ncbi:hypothetical protein O6H91_22G012300 [Diphasiastrum complanatum]|uniref:Uncharacterized protein n=3 Tax=Diphasiastrum complanatum TaxID=34168 RepID=A0ACC2ACW8_DIPCM|nr:hypothetical protein O6H91_22G012300 [Diphasiastrum complanatum]KAJ7515401.1 hypothetical protein O6H91_22G012300 [Diphasiastrum complanatum]KAJ7515405.1 hypothetical protein O6H91_22G012300 [Diphasiastrum complanatum]
MVKFQKHMKGQLVPEWREGYCNYKQLKKDVNVIKHDLLKQLQNFESGDNRSLPDGKQQAQKASGYPLWTFASLAKSIRVQGESLMVVHNKRIEVYGVDEELYETELLGPFSEAQHEKNFFVRLDAQLNKVNKFYKHKEEEYIVQARQLRNQADALLELKKALSTDHSQHKSDNDQQKKCPRDINGEYVKWKLDGFSPCKNRVQRAEKMLRMAISEFYRGLQLLKGYSSLNLMAFSKILKKFDKVTGQNAASTYLRVVRSSYFMSSNQIINLMDLVEELYTKQFAKRDQKLPLAYLKPRPPPDSLNFTLGLFAGCSWSLTVAFILMLIVSKNCLIFGGTSYMTSVFPVFSTLLLFVLHMYIYGFNIYLWHRARINYAFIFEFAPGTELRLQDLLLISAGLTTLVTGGMIIHLSLYTLDFKVHNLREIVPVAIFLITALRNIGYIFCYYGGGYYRRQDSAGCIDSAMFVILQYLLSVLPYWWRLMQCVRKWLDDCDQTQMVNGGKYLSAMIAVMMRLTYARFNSNSWLALFVTSSILATIYQLGWDIVVDWGLFQCHSRNPWLRDDLILKQKFIYFISMALNLILRLTWLFTLTPLQHGGLNHNIVDCLFASLEVLRRGHWNFYRVENEHLKKVGRFRAVRSMPLSFKDIDATEMC